MTPNDKNVDQKIDEESCKGRFGWREFEKHHIPYIFRTGNKDKYISVRMLEQKVLNRYLNVLPSEVISCLNIHSFYITEAESRLLNDINVNHTGYHFGKTSFNGKDLIVRLEDATEFYHFLVLYHNRVVKKQCNPSDRCGFVRIGGESVVPFTLHRSKQYVPTFYFEEVTEHLQLNSMQIEGWDLVYLKFCCKVQGIRQTLFASEVCNVVPLDQIKNYFPPGTTFEDYWPAKDPWSTTSKNVPSASWTIKPSSDLNNSNIHSIKASEDMSKGSTRLQQSNHPTTPASTNPKQLNTRPTPQQKKTGYQERETNKQGSSVQITMVPPQKQTIKNNNNNNTDRQKRVRS